MNLVKVEEHLSSISKKNMIIQLKMLPYLLIYNNLQFQK